MPSNAHRAFKYARNGKESFYIEARRRTSAAADSRNTALPGSGLLIWHVHTDGKNTDLSRGFPLLTLMQADGRNDLERKANNGDAGDPFRARHNAIFNSATNPAAVYYDGVPSNIKISEISDSGAVMAFRASGTAGSEPSLPTTGVETAHSGQSPYGIKASRSGGRVTFTLPVAGYVSLKIYTMRGRPAGTLVDGMRNAGTHTADVKGKVTGRGMYIIRMRSGGYEKDIKMRNL
jgi:hypothetical protein